MASPEEVEKQRQTDHDTLIRVENKIENLTKTVEQNTLTMSAALQSNTQDIAVLKLEIDRLKTGLVLTRWFFGAIVTLLGLAIAIYSAVRQ